MNKIIIKNKHHNHFTNTCFKCGHDDHDDSAMVPILVTRMSGLIPKEHFEADYMCTMCAVKIPTEQLEFERV
jgi:hypothetical protein